MDKTESILQLDKATQSLHQQQLNRQQLRAQIYESADVDSLLGKTANFAAANAAIMLDVFGKILAGEDIKAAIKPYAPLILRLQEGIKNGEFKAVSTAQGMNHTEAIIEGLQAYTKVAAIFEQQATVN